MSLRPLTGRELNEQHKALVEVGMSWRFTLDWLRRETDLWILERSERGNTDSWFWCVEHQNATQQVGPSCTPVGPYATRDEAVDWGGRIRRFDEHTRLWANEIAGRGNTESPS